MVRIHNPVPKNKRNQKGIDNQKHGGTMESIDQLSGLVVETVGNNGGETSNNE